MIFDDHEVTDDWNMTRNICRRSMATSWACASCRTRSSPIRCASTGATRRSSSKSARSPPGEKLLLLLDGTNAANYDVNSRGASAHWSACTTTQSWPTRPDNGSFHDADCAHLQLHGGGSRAPGHRHRHAHVAVLSATAATTAPDFLPEDPTAAADRQHACHRATAPCWWCCRPTRRRCSPSAPRRSTRRSPERRARRRCRPTSTRPGRCRATPIRPALQGHQRQVAAGGGQAPRSRDAAFGRCAHELCFAAAVQGHHAVRRPADAPAAGEHGLRAAGVPARCESRPTRPKGMHREATTTRRRERLARAGNKPEGYVGWNLPAASRRVGQVARTTPAAAGPSHAIEANGPKTVSICGTPSSAWCADDPARLFVPARLSLRGAAGALPPRAAHPAHAHGRSRRQTGKRAAEAFHKATGSYRMFNKANATRQRDRGREQHRRDHLRLGRGRRRSSRCTPCAGATPTASDMFTTYVCSLDPNDPTFPELKPLDAMSADP